MSDGLSDADKIRNKRLAKLSAQAQSSNAATEESKQQATSQASSISPSQSAAPKPVTSPTNPNPFAKLNSKPDTQNKAAATPPKPSPQPTHKRDASGEHSGTRSRTRPQGGATEKIEDWEHKTLSNVFRITLNPEQTHDAHGNPLHYCGDLHEELSSADVPIRLSNGTLESALMDAATNQENVNPLDYMLGCWKRISRLFRGMRSGSSDDPKFQIVKEARRLCMSYSIFAATMPDMFGHPSPEGSSLAPHLLLDPDSDRGICHDFLTEAVTRFEEDDSIREALVAAMEQLSRELSSKTMNDDYKPYMFALRSFIRHPALVSALSESAQFLPADTPAQAIEKRTLLGPFFQISPTQGEVAMNYFSGAKTRDRGYILNSQSALRMTLQTHQTELSEIVDRFIKTSKDTRERMLDWFAHTVNVNHKRRAMRPDPLTISSDGFMNNVTVCLDRLCEPFMDATFSKIDRIEPEYFRRNPRVKIDDETKMNADQSAADSFYGNKAEGTSNFISEVFFLTVAAHHYGPEATNSKLSGLRRDIRNMEQQIEAFEREREKYINNAWALARFDERLNRFKHAAEQAQCVCYSIEGVLMDELMQARSMSVMRYVIVWVLRLVSGVDFPKQKFQIPLPSEQPEVFKTLPEYFVEDVVDHFKWITNHIPHVITPTQCDELVMICITFLRSSEYIKNPYLKSGLVTILFYGVMPFSRTSVNGVLTDVLNSLPFANQHLLHALMQFYIECEATGAHNQFYDKFNIRYEIFQVIKAIWPNPVYRENLMEESRVNTDFFVRFVNLVLNDVTYVLDESFTSFKSINSLSAELRNAGAMDEQTRKEKEEALEAAQGKAKSYMQLTNESLATLILFTEALADAFTSSEVVQRLADMLDYNLDALTGPKSRNLRVERPDEYRFDPLRLLNQVITVYLNLADKHSFQQAIARDGRSYKPQLFEMALMIINTKGGKSDQEKARWRKLGADVQQIKEEEEAEEEDLGEIPDEFMDPLMATLMQDPVILPVSKTVMDRSTIRQHLLSDPHDPFNRAPLKIEDVIPDTETKAKIQAFIQERKAAKAASKTEDSLTRMDTTPG